MKKVPHIISIVASFALILALFAAYAVAHAPKGNAAPDLSLVPAAPLPSFTHPLTIGARQITVALASTPDVQEQGLSGTSSLADGEGMLFVFPTANSIPFWMKDMRYPIDIIWIGADKTVVDISAGLAPATYPGKFSSKAMDQYVLEVPSGFAEQNHIGIGTPVSF